MEDFEADRTTLLSWTFRAQAQSEAEALEEPQRFASCPVTDPRGCLNRQ
jgi:hypothetical protein